MCQDQPGLACFDSARGRRCRLINRVLIVWVLDLSVRRLGAQIFGFSDVCLDPLGLTSVLRNGKCYPRRGPDRPRRLGKAPRTLGHLRPTKPDLTIPCLSVICQIPPKVTFPRARSPVQTRNAVCRVTTPSESVCVLPPCWPSNP